MTWPRCVGNMEGIEYKVAAWSSSCPGSVRSGVKIMSVLVLDQSTIEKLKAVVVGVQIRGEQGNLIGYFHPVGSPEAVDQYECPVSEDELLRRARDGGGRPLRNILSDLRNRS